MPIYAYKCESCGHRQDVLQKISDPLLTQCPACAASTFVKQVTAAGFQLKGSGWYVTDFRDSGGKKSAGDAAAAKPPDADKGGDQGDKSSAGPSANAPTPAAAQAGAAASADSGASAPAAPAPAAVSAPTP